jgi:hypothetical protein
MALGGDAGRNYGKPAALSGGERGAGGAPMHGELNLSDRGGGNLSDVAGRSGTRLAGGVVGGGGRRWTSWRGCWVSCSPWGFGWLTGGSYPWRLAWRHNGGKRAEEEEGTQWGGCSPL